MARPTKEELKQHREEVLKETASWLEDIDETIGITVDDTETKEDTTPIPKSTVKQRGRSMPKKVAEELARKERPLETK